MMGRPSKYPDEFRAEAVRLARAAKADGRPLSHVARELGLNAQSLHNWVNAAEIESGDREGLTKSERAELVKLRRENKRLLEEKEILGKAAAFFAKEGKYTR